MNFSLLYIKVNKQLNEQQISLNKITFFIYIYRQQAFKNKQFMPNHKRNIKFLKQNNTNYDYDNIPLIKPIPNTNNQTQLKQIYESVTGPTYNNKIVPNSKKHTNRYQLPLQLKNVQQYQEPKSSVRYRSFLQSHQINPVSSVMRSNNINSKNNNQISTSRRRIESVNNLKNQLSALSGRKSNAGNETDRVSKNNNQNVNHQMFKIRSKKSSHSGSLKKKDEQQNIKNDKPRDRDDTPLNHPSLQTSDQLQLGKNQYKHGNYKEALKHFQKSLQSNPRNLSSIYYIAMIHLKQKQYEQGLKNLQKIIEREPKFKKTIYLFASISLKNMNNLKKAIQYCNKGLQLYGNNNFVDLLFYKGKLLQQLQDIQAAIQVYQNVIKQKKDHVQALLNLSKCFYDKKLYNNSLSLLSSAIYYDKGQFKNQMLLLRIKICLQLGKLKQVKKDLIKLKQQREKQDCQYLYLSGKLLIKQQKTSQAIINFQKCLRQESNSFTQLKSNALIEIVKVKINIKDFYSSYHHINRSKYLQIDTKQIKIFKHFIEGIIFLMKRKVDDAMKNFQQFVKLMPNLQQDDYFNPMFYLYRAFGYFMQNKQELSIKDYQYYEKSTSLDKYTLYNLLLSKGIVKVQNKDFESSLDYFNKCQQLFLPNAHKIEPYIYRAITYVEEAKQLTQPFKQLVQSDEKVEDDIKILELVFLGLKQLDKAYDINQGNSNMLFIRALIYTYLNKYEQALDDIIKAISKSQENIPKYFFYRALLQQTQQNKKQALNDFNICTNLDPNYAQVYLQRSKLFFSLQNYTKGLQDLQKYQQLRPQEDIELLKASLYYVNGLYPIADQSVQNVKDQTSYKYLKFHILLKLLRIQEAKNYLNEQCEADRLIMNIISGDYQSSVEQLIPSPKKLKYFNVIHYYHYLGVAFFKKGLYQKAIQQFVMAMKQCNLRDLQKNSTNIPKKEQNQQNLGERDIHCINFNIFLTYLKLNQKRKAYQIFVRDILPVNENILKSQFMANFSHVLFQSIKLKNQQELSQKQQAQIEIFSNLFTDLSDQLIIQTTTFILRTKLCYLNVSSQKVKAQFSPKINTQFVLKSLNIKQIQNRPQPPWVKRQSYDEGLIFTDQIQNINIQFQTTQNDEQDQEYEQDQANQEQQQNQEEEQQQESVQQQQRFDPRKFRDQMKLDFDIEKKLQKIMQKKRKPSTDQ